MMMKTLIPALLALCLQVPAQADIRQDLSRLYPEQSQDTLSKRIARVKSAPDFFRSFTPYFHYRLSNGLFQTSPWNQVRNQIGWCLGDPHPENFGTLLSEKGQAFYGPNDIDDAHPCPQAADILRFLTGWNLWVGEGATEELLATYMKARKSSQSFPIPPTIALLLRESEIRGRLPRLKWYHPNLHILRRRSDVIAVPSPFDREVAQAAIQILKGKGQVIQVAERVRLDGGSGGVKRFLVLVNYADNPLLLEFKEIVRPATFPWGIPLWDPFLRIKTAWDWEQKSTKTPFHETTSLFGRPFHTRPLWEGEMDFDLDQLTGLQKREVAHFQASLLGALHRNSPIRVGGNIDLIPAAVWSKAVSVLAQEMTRAYDELRGPIERYSGRTDAQ